MVWAERYLEQRAVYRIASIPTIVFFSLFHVLEDVLRRRGWTCGNDAVGTDQTGGRPDTGGLYSSYRQNAPGAPLYRKQMKMRDVKARKQMLECVESRIPLDSTHFGFRQDERELQLAGQAAGKVQSSILLFLCVAFRTFFFFFVRFGCMLFTSDTP